MRHGRQLHDCIRDRTTVQLLPIAWASVERNLGLAPDCYRQESAGGFTAQRYAGRGICYNNFVRLSVRPSVRHTRALCQNG